MAVSETNMFIEAISQQAADSKDLFVFDRYYASQLLYFLLAQQEVRFCFRLKLNWWMPAKKFYASGKSSEVLTIQLPQADRERAQQLGITLTTMRVRLVRVELPGGLTELLLTNLINERQFSVAAIKELYALRWPVEEAYKSFKHKVCLENFSGKSKKAVLQDFYVKLFIMNLTAVMVGPINQALAKNTVRVKHHHQCNFTEALATMKKAVVSLFITNKVTTTLHRCIERFFRFTEPIRPGRNNKRKKLPKRKHYINYKLP
jgi:hypothetical protein